MTHPRPGADARGLLALVAGAAMIGLAPLWVRWSEVGPVATAFYRLALALPFLAAWARAERRPAPSTSPPLSSPTPTPIPTSASASASLESRRHLLTWAAAGGVMFGIDLGAWHLSIRYTSVANATLLANFAPIFVTLGAWICLREPTHRRFFAGMGLAFAGAWLLTGARPGADPTRLHGDLLGLVTALFYGGYQLCVARLRRSLSAGQVLWWCSLAATPVLAVMAALFHEPFLPATTQGWIILAGLALTAQLLGQGLITYGFAHLPAGLSSLTLLVQPLVAVIAAWLVFHEALSLPQALGGVILVAGILLARRPGKAREP